jgi:hypothetical protein
MTNELPSNIWLPHIAISFLAALPQFASDCWEFASHTDVGVARACGSRLHNFEVVTPHSGGGSLKLSLFQLSLDSWEGRIEKSEITNQCWGLSFNYQIGLGGKYADQTPFRGRI